MHIYDIEMIDTFAGEANYAWVKRAKVRMPELTHYGYDGGTNYAKCDKIYRRELVRKAKAAMGMTGVRSEVEWTGDECTIRLRRMLRVIFVTWSEE